MYVVLVVYRIVRKTDDAAGAELAKSLSQQSAGANRAMQLDSGPKPMDQPMHWDHATLPM